MMTKTMKQRCSKLVDALYCTYHGKILQRGTEKLEQWHKTNLDRICFVINLSATLVPIKDEWYS